VTDNKRADRGQQSQVIFAADLRAKGVLQAESAPRSTKGSDVLGWPGVDVEVKATEVASPTAWLAQVKKRAVEGVLGLTVYRPRGSGPSNVEDWPVTLRWGDLVPLLRLAGHLPPLPADPVDVRAEAVDVPASSSQPPTPPRG
jgi:hypothetical protein